MKIIRHVQLCLSSTYISDLLHLTDKFDNTKGCDLTVSTYAIVKASLHRFAHNISVLASRGKNRNDGGKVHTLHSPLWAFYCDSTEKHQTEKIHALTTYLQNCTVRSFWFFVKPSVIVVFFTSFLFRIIYVRTRTTGRYRLMWAHEFSQSKRVLHPPRQTLSWDCMVTSCTTWECTVTHDTFIPRASLFLPPPPPLHFFFFFFSSTWCSRISYWFCLTELGHRMDLGSTVLCVCLRVGQCERLASPRKSRPVASMSPLKKKKINKGSVHTFLPVWSWFKTIRIVLKPHRIEWAYL